MHKLKIVNQLRFFNNLSEEDREAVARLSLRIFKYENRAHIIKASGKDTNLYILIKGTATVVSDKGDPLAIFRPGDVFGEVSFLADRPRTASVVANNQVIVMRVDKESFQTLGPSVREKLKDALIELLIDRLFTQRGGEVELSVSPNFNWTTEES